MASRYRRVSKGIYERDGKFSFKVRKDGKQGWSEQFLSQEAAEEAHKRYKRRGTPTYDELVSDFFERWDTDYRRERGESTIKTNLERASKFVEDFGDRTMRSITKVEARQWVQQNPSRLESVRAMFTDAMNDGLTDGNPFYGLGRKKKDRTHILNEHEVGLLVRTAEDKWGDYGRLYFAPMIEVAAYTGLRPGEMYALRRSDIDYERERIHVQRQYSAKLNKFTPIKNDQGDGRVIPLLPEAAAALQSVPPPTASSESIFRTTRGKPFSQRVHHYYWDPVRTAFWAKLSPERQEQIPSDLDFYTLRHYFGSLLARRNFSAIIIAKAMGHNDNGRTAQDHYIRIRDADEVFDAVMQDAHSRQRVARQVANG